jgi:hypothetical protein
MLLYTHWDFKHVTVNSDAYVIYENTLHCDGLDISAVHVTNALPASLVGPRILLVAPRSCSHRVFPDHYQCATPLQRVKLLVFPCTLLFDHAVSLIVHVRRTLDMRVNFTTSYKEVIESRARYAAIDRRELTSKSANDTVAQLYVDRCYTISYYQWA